MITAKKWLLIAFIISAVARMEAATVNFSVQGIAEGDELAVVLGSDTWMSTLVASEDGDYNFNDVPQGLHALKISGSGYNLPDSKLVRVNADGSVDPAVGIQLVVTKMDDDPDKWIHEWHQDGSVEGYTQTSHVNTRPEIEFLGKKIVPSDVPYMTVLNTEYNILLSDEEQPWTQEYAYRMVETLKTLPGSGTGHPKTKCLLTDQHLTDDITLEKNDDGYILTISKDAFYYANPFLVNLDGVRGRFFSKRLHHALVKFLTDYGQDKWKANQILQSRFGVTIYPPDYESLTAATTQEDAECFQEFGPSELVAIINMFEEMPEGFHKIPNLKYLIRRHDGHPHPEHPEAAAVAWAQQDGYIEFMNSTVASAFSGTNENFETQRLIIHEKTHFLWAYTFSQELKNDWIEIGGWYRDPNAGDDPDSGWSTTKTTEFVTQYAHDNNPNEDMAESVAFYLKDPEKLQSRAPEKYEFIRDRVMHGTRYISSIPEHLSFEVLNLYPDYDYPGKIKRVSISVEGAPEDEKIITMEIELNHEEGFQDDASRAYVRITSPEFIDQYGRPTSQFVDIWMGPVDGNGHILRGSNKVSQYSKNGYWTCGTIRTYDLAGNERYEGRNDCVTNVYINNPLEDIEVPVYKGGLDYELTTGVEEGHEVQYLKITYDVTDNVGIKKTFARVDNDYEGWSKGGTGLTDCYGSYNEETGKAEIIYTIPEFYPTANYFVTFIETIDLAGSWSQVNFSESPLHEPIKKIAITTPNPDYDAPEVDLNRMVVYAEPTHPENPDGETLVAVNFYVRDNISGLGPMYYYFRDPQGNKHGNYWFYHQHYYGRFFSGDPTVWEHYQITHILPQGSAPGIWGLAEMTLNDKAGNSRTYNFVETLIFEPDDSDDYILFADMEDNNTVVLQVTSEINPGYGFTYRIIHEESGQEITGEYPGADAMAEALDADDRSDDDKDLHIDVSSLDNGKLVVIVKVKDENGECVSIKSKTILKDTLTSIGNVFVRTGDAIDYNSPFEIYNLNGMPVASEMSELTAGVYIVRQGAKASKIVVRN